ncbi:metal ABC transporter solute-binding protein, Zn/Mn family [Alkalibacterium sp. f15]|uniref:metal ABC transporter solute-binding protein, Zn/Mn family n=1 Tax=Alkalibacterium sp. f15 TaxID=3414029 RepID=UPI003BF80892
MINKKRFILLPMLLVAVTISACTAGNSGETSDAQLSIVSSFYPVYEFTQQVAGDKADITLMVGSGADPHSYEPSAKNIAEINNADMFVYSSEKMEFWITSLLNSIDNEELKIVRTAEGLERENHFDTPSSTGMAKEDSVESVSIAPYDVTVLGVAGHYHSGDTLTLRAQFEETVKWRWYTKKMSGDWTQIDGLTDDRFEYTTNKEDLFVQAVAVDAEGNEIAQSEVARIHIDDHDEEDPHIWLDPVLAKDQVCMIEEALIEVDPDNEAYYAENAQQFIEELEKLHKEYEEAFKDAENRSFVVQHQAFGYIASRYNLTQIAIGGLSTEVEPSPARIAEIGKLVEANNVPVIYYQQGGNSAIAQTVANETDTETAILHDLEILSGELRGKDLGYLDAMRENLKALKLSIN